MADWDTAESSGWEAGKWDTDGTGKANDGWDDPAPLAERDTNVESNGFHDANANGGNDKTCRNCGGEGHFARECTEPKKFTGECFNCGQVGHNKSDCPNPKVARPFTGKCRICDEEGHPAAECPQREPITCKNCQEQGHKTTDCEKARVLDYSNVETVTTEEAWKLLETASQEKDIDDFKDAVKMYAKADREVTYAGLEKKFMDAGFKVHLVALEKEIPITMTNVDLQGKNDCKYSVSYYFDVRPVRAKFADGWPESAEDNLSRLENAGESMNQVVPVCRNCNELGHTSKHCRVEAPAPEPQQAVTCVNCNESGHRARDCTKERVEPGACKNCKQPGHRAAECPEPRSAENVECKICKEMGHFAKDCPTKGDSGPGGARMCRNCGEEGHFAKECEKPRDPMAITCRNCDEQGHISKECPKPRDYSRVKCSQCGEMGHTIKRCTKGPTTDEAANGQFEKNGSAPPASEGDWGTANTAAADATVEGDWNQAGGDSAW